MMPSFLNQRCNVRCAHCMVRIDAYYMRIATLKIGSGGGGGDSAQRPGSQVMLSSTSAQLCPHGGPGTRSVTSLGA